jgi:hypothetical protein
MKGVYNFIIRPKLSRHESKKKVGDNELILNTELQNHQYVSRIGVVISVPSYNPTDIKEGDEIIVHHNVFRRFYDVRGNEKNSKSYYEDNMFFVAPDQIFAFKPNKEWISLDDFCFIKPIENNDKFSLDKEKPLVGVLKYFNKKNKANIKVGDLVGFCPGFEYEFIIDNQKLYRVPINKITIKYEYKGNEKEYNPSWASSS